MIQGVRKVPKVTAISTGVVYTIDTMLCNYYLIAAVWRCVRYTVQHSVKLQALGLCCYGEMWGWASMLYCGNTKVVHRQSLLTPENLYIPKFLLR